MRKAPVFVLWLALASAVASTQAFAFSVALPTQWSTEAAVAVLREGGNATDAMVAGAFVLNVTQPYNMGVGGGGFFLARAGSKTYLWNSRELAPASAHDKMFLDKQGKPLEYYPDRVTGPNPVGVPGMVAGLWAAHRKLGKLPWKKLLQPAIRLAKEGFPLTPNFAAILEEEWPRLAKYPTSAAIFGARGDGASGPLKVGHVLRNPALARTIEAIANEGADAFYRGALAKAWTAEAAKLGVKITADDLAAYKVRVDTPVEYRVFGLRAQTAAPSSASGIMVAGTLRFLEHYYATHELPAAESPARVIVTTEALRYFQRLRNEKLGDPPYGQIDPQRFLGSADEKAAWAEIEKNVTSHRDRIETAVTLEAAKPAATVASSESGKSHTAHLSIIDDQGNAIAYTVTIEQWFGSAMVVPTYGFLLNNELSDFDAEPGHPNSPAAGKRPRSNMSPTLLFDAKDRVVGVVGCAGGGRIPTTIVEVLENYFLQKMSLRAALAFPRFHPDDKKLEIDPAVAEATREKLKEAGYDLDVSVVRSTPQMIVRRDASEAWEAAADPRGDGLALVLDPKWPPRASPRRSD